MKRALYIGGFTMPDGNAAAQRVLGIAKLLCLRNYDVRLCGLTHQINTGTEEGVIDGFKYCNYPYPVTLCDWSRYLTGHDFAIYEVERFDPQVVILYNHPALAIEHIVKYCHKKNIRVLADITEWYKPEGNWIFRTIKGYDTRRRMTFSHLKLDGLICISSFLAEYYRSRGSKVIELPPLVDIEQSKWHQPIEQHDDEIRIVYAGSPGKTKDRLDLILKAMDNIVLSLKNPLRFDIIGVTKEQYRKTWGDYRERAFVVFNGRLSHNEVIKKLLGADYQVFLRPDTLPNRAGFPTKFVESITSGTLPITNLSSNLSQFLKDGKTGFLISSLDPGHIELSLKKAFELKKCDIDILREGLERDVFDYRKYIDLISSIL